MLKFSFRAGPHNPYGQILMSVDTFYHCDPLLQVKQYLFELLYIYIYILYIYIIILYMYIFPGQDTLPTWGRILMSTDTLCQFGSLLQVSVCLLLLFFCCCFFLLFFFFFFFFFFFCVFFPLNCEFLNSFHYFYK